MCKSGIFAKENFSHLQEFASTGEKYINWKVFLDNVIICRKAINRRKMLETSVVIPLPLVTYSRRLNQDRYFLWCGADIFRTE